jgi:hypothetical protein
MDIPMEILYLFMATPHSDGLWCSIETFFSIILSVFLKLFHLKKNFFHHSPCLLNFGQYFSNVLLSFEI